MLLISTEGQMYTHRHTHSLADHEGIVWIILSGLYDVQSIVSVFAAVDAS